MSKVLITGGAGDIARAIQKRLEGEGYTVLAPSHAQMDVTDGAAVESVMQDFVPDVLVNNAGYVVPQSMRSCDLVNTKKHIDINLTGTFYCTQIALKYNPKVDIINIASAAAIETHAEWSAYCASKAAVVMATRCWAEDGIYAVAVSPGRTRTKMRKSLYPDEDPDTLLEPADFAAVVAKAVRREYEPGAHIVVRRQNVKQLLAE
jgi:3-oxoacyl-[acyl-carrier protein] reductase